MALTVCEIGKDYLIDDININSLIKKRLQALGLIKGTPVKIISNQIKGSIVVKVRGSRLVLGNDIADSICVNEISNMFCGV